VIISSLRTAAFRNLADVAVNVCAKNVFLVGKNGQGKTNFIEALYFCAYASSFRGAKDVNLANTNEKNFSVEIKLVENKFNETESGDVLVKIEKEKKTVFINGKKSEDRKELLSVVPCIVFCHEDMNFVNGSPEQRRWFFDQVLSLYDPVYLDDLRRYKKAVKSRNAILRDNLKQKLTENIDAILDALDHQCSFYGTRLMEKRETACALFSEIFQPLYSEVSGIAGIGVKYAPSWKSADETAALKQLASKRPVEMAAGISLSGPHRDRYSFAIDGEDFVANASTGQRRLLALLLRVSQARMFSRTTGKKPVLLLDDVLLEMDGEKRHRFFSALPDYSQAFFTFLPEEPFRQYQSDDTIVYNVCDGSLELVAK